MFGKPSIKLASLFVSLSVLVSTTFLALLIRGDISIYVVSFLAFFVVWNTYFAAQEVLQLLTGKPPVTREEE